MLDQPSLVDHKGHYWSHCTTIDQIREIAFSNPHQVYYTSVKQKQKWAPVIQKDTKEVQSWMRNVESTQWSPRANHHPTYPAVWNGLKYLAGEKKVCSVHIIRQSDHDDSDDEEPFDFDTWMLDNESKDEEEDHT